MTNKKVAIFGVPFGLGGKRLGSNLGPSAIRLTNLAGCLSKHGFNVVDKGDIYYHPEEVALDRGSGIGYFEQVFRNLTETRNAVGEAIAENYLPIVVGGDHSLSIATIASALEYYGKDLGVLWIDAHADLNTPDTSPSGNLHGMPLGLLLGYECGMISGPHKEQWDKLKSAMLNGRSLAFEKVVWIAARDLDAHERKRLLEKDIEQVITMHELDRYGLAKMYEHILKVFAYSGVKKLWVSFDIDALDPLVAPGTGTSVRGGLTYREAHLLAELLHETLTRKDAPFELVGIDIAEINPVLDNENETAIMANEWIMSMFGKRILPMWQKR